MSRYNRGVSSAIDFATAEELGRAPPEPPQPPPPAPGARGEWRWVWVPEQADVRDRPAGDSEPTSASRPRLTSSSVAPVPRRSDRSSAETPTGVEGRSSRDSAGVVEGRSSNRAATSPRAEREREVPSHPATSPRAARESGDPSRLVTTSTRAVREGGDRPRPAEASARAVREDRTRPAETSARAERERGVRTSGTARAERDTASASTPVTTRRTIRVPARTSSTAGTSEVSRTGSRGSLRPAEPKAAPKATVVAKAKAEPRSSPDSSVASTRPGTSVERPLIVLDWHRTLSFESQSGGSYVPERVKQTLRRAQSLGYDLGICSFASAPATQSRVLREARDLETELTRAFRFIHVVNRKFTSDPARDRPSLTGCATSKAEEVCRVGAAIFVDDHRSLLQEVEQLQARRAAGNRCRVLISHANRPSAALEELDDLLEEESAADFGLPSFLRSLW